MLRYVMLCYVLIIPYRVSHQVVSLSLYSVTIIYSQFISVTLIYSQLTNVSLIYRQFPVLRKFINILVVCYLRLIIDICACYEINAVRGRGGGGGGGGGAVTLIKLNTFTAHTNDNAYMRVCVRICMCVIKCTQSVQVGYNIHVRMSVISVHGWF